jgi:hypothetical protein
LTSLELLSLYGNTLSGGIPTDICNLSTNLIITACSSVCTDSSTASGCCDESVSGC